MQSLKGVITIFVFSYFIVWILSVLVLAGVIMDSSMVNSLDYNVLNNPFFSVVWMIFVGKYLYVIGSIFFVWGIVKVRKDNYKAVYLVMDILKRVWAF